MFLRQFCRSDRFARQLYTDQAFLQLTESQSIRTPGLHERKKYVGITQVNKPPRHLFDREQIERRNPR